MGTLILTETIDERFNRFHADHPNVYEELVTLARHAKASGYRKLGIAMLWEVLRWNMMLSVQADGFKLNNSYRSRYARLIMDNEPDLDGIFDVREIRRI